jgi:hypothetical protein
VTREDIRDASRDILHSPLTRAVQRMLGKSWIVFMCTRAIETIAPYRFVLLPDEAMRHCEQHVRSGEMEPFEFELPVENSKANGIFLEVMPI